MFYEITVGDILYDDVSFRSTSCVVKLPHNAVRFSKLVANGANRDACIQGNPLCTEQQSTINVAYLLYIQ